MRELITKAKRLGIEPGDYARQLIEEGMAIQWKAETSSFAQITEPVRETADKVEDAEVLKLVETARSEHHRRQKRKKR